MFLFYFVNAVTGFTVSGNAYSTSWARVCVNKIVLFFVCRDCFFAFVVQSSMRIGDAANIFWCYWIEVVAHTVFCMWISEGCDWLFDLLNSWILWLLIDLYPRLTIKIKLVLTAYYYTCALICTYNNIDTTFFNE